MCSFAAPCSTPRRCAWPKSASNREPARPIDFSTSYRSIRDTRLAGVFTKYPWNGGRTLWPRVALVIEASTAGGTPSFAYMRPGDAVEDRCWRISARLWTGPGHSEDIAPFNWCLSEMRFNVPTNDIFMWAGTPKATMHLNGMGPDGTLGPMPPYKPAPDRWAELWAPQSVMLANLLAEMAFEPGLDDGRVWVIVRDSQRAAAPTAAPDRASVTTRDATTPVPPPATTATGAGDDLTELDPVALIDACMITQTDANGGVQTSANKAAFAQSYKGHHVRYAGTFDKLKSSGELVFKSGGTWPKNYRVLADLGSEQIGRARALKPGDHVIVEGALSDFEVPKFDVGVGGSGATRGIRLNEAQLVAP